jgi:hypothetical protein
MSLSPVLPVSKNARTVFDFSDQELSVVEERMRPGRWSTEGFLQTNDRLMSVCMQDGQTLLKENVPCHLIADVLSSIIEAAQKSNDPSPVIWGKFKVERHNLATNGYQECPFAKSKESSCHRGRSDPTVTNVTNGISILVNNLTVDMIREHFFFQTGPYRLDPQRAIECLELRSTKYEMVVNKVATFESAEALNDQDQEEVVEYEKEKSEAKKYTAPQQIAPGVTGYILPYKDREAYENHGLTVEQKIRKQGEAEGLTEAQIQMELKSHTKFSCMFNRTPEERLSKVIERKEKDGEQFLHVFNDKRLSEDQGIMEINGFELPTSIELQGTYVFQLTEKTRVNMGQIHSTKKSKLK